MVFLRLYRPMAEVRGGRSPYFRIRWHDRHGVRRDTSAGRTQPAAERKVKQGNLIALPQPVEPSPVESTVGVPAPAANPAGVPARIAWAVRRANAMQASIGFEPTAVGNALVSPT